MTPRSLSRIVIFALFITVGFPASADWFHKIIRYRCEPKANRLIVTYEGAYNEEGELLIRNKGADAWDPWELLRTDKKKEQIIGAKTIKKQCALADGKYIVAISGIYENSNPAGHCGAHVTAKVVILKAQRNVYATPFEGSCDEIFSSTVTTEVVVTGNSMPPQIKEVSGNDFYR
jgi:hypothetical protein